jgi:hypothetical protein
MARKRVANALADPAKQHPPAEITSARCARCYKPAVVILAAWAGQRPNGEAGACAQHEDVERRHMAQLGVVTERRLHPTTEDDGGTLF